jgi:hypothetical protein
MGILIDRPNNIEHNIPKQCKLDGIPWFDVVLEPWSNGAMQGVYNKTVVTGRGLEGISKLLKKHFETWWVK